jgi:hypothetical protein
MTDTKKERRRAEILAWMQANPDYDFFHNVPATNEGADVDAVMAGIFSGVEKLKHDMSDAIPDLTIEDLVEVMFGDAEYWAKHPPGAAKPREGRLSTERPAD